MNGDQYIESMVKKYNLPQQISSDMQLKVINPLSNIINKWAGACLYEIKISGSRAKGTAISLSTDLDLFISLKSSTSNTLKEIYNSLYDTLVAENISAKKQNVSIGVKYSGYDVDLIPAKKQDNYSSDHSIYRSKADTWTKTNIITHINTIKNSGRITEIVATKIWRERFCLDFPSMYLELSVIEALFNKNKNQPATNFQTVFNYLSNNFVSKTIYDPANTNNVISDDLYKYEKEKIAEKAKESLAEQYWKNVIW